MLEIEDYYDIDEIRELELRKWPRSSLITEEVGIGAGVVEPNTSLDQINGRGEEGFYIQCEGIVLIFGRLNENWKNRDPQSFHTSSLT